MKKKNRAKWIGSGIFTGICLWFTQVSSMELGGFDVEVGIGEGQEVPSDWWEEPETAVEEETGTEQEYREAEPEQNLSEDILTGGEGVTEEVYPENPPAGTAENHQPVSQQENTPENPPHSENQQESMAGSRTDTATEEQIFVPAVSEPPTSSVVPLPSPSPILSPNLSLPFMQEPSGPFSVFLDFSVSFSHPSVPQNQRNPYVEIQSEGQFGIVSVRHNYQECFWWREGNRLFWEMEPSKGKNKIEILVITEDCRLVMMEPWIYTGRE